MKPILIFSFALLVSCHSAERKQEVESDRAEVAANSHIADTSEDETSYEDTQKEYTLMYDRKEKIDTSFKVNNQTFNLLFEHYCLNDDTLIIPSKYSWSKSPKDFVTHSFVSKLLLIQNQTNDTIVNTLVKKKFFKELLDENLAKYGVLLYPTYRGFNQEKNVVQIHYSISIPLTDVGKSVLLDIGINGDIIPSE